MGLRHQRCVGQPGDPIAGQDGQAERHGQSRAFLLAEQAESRREAVRQWIQEAVGA